jgi:hypothetical protein
MRNDALGQSGGPASLRLDGPAGSHYWLEASLRDDRWEHRLCRAAPAGESPLIELRSCESRPDSAWPKSPPIQQLVLEDLPDSGPTLLGVGMAGSGHWSLSIHCDPSLGLVFDVACRIGSDLPSWLGSSYLSPLPASVLPASGYLHALTGCQLQISPTEAADQVRLNATSLQAMPRETLRWSYCFRPPG